MDNQKLNEEVERLFRYYLGQDGKKSLCEISPAAHTAFHDYFLGLWNYYFVAATGKPMADANADDCYVVLSHLERAHAEGGDWLVVDTLQRANPTNPFSVENIKLRASGAPGRYV
jgi:hypothetical protein